MKKFFAKYLRDANAVIKDGNLIEHAVTNNRMIATKDMGLGYLTMNTDWEVLKLFICSRDIQVGDIIHFPLNRYTPVQYLGGDLTGYEFKIIGQISPKAIWVKEGDEFDIEELSFAHICTSPPFEGEKIVSFEKFMKIEDRDEHIKRIKILSSHCKHFH